MASTVFPLIGKGAPAINQSASGNFIGAAQTGTGVALPFLAPAAAVPIVGGIIAAVGAIAGSLLAASAKRAAEAKDENSAVTSAVQHVDQGLQQVFSAANAGTIDANGALQLLDQIKQQYWQIVGPHVQPGRNGCQSGAAIPSRPADNTCGSIAYQGCNNSSWGAGCCVASVIYKSLDNAAFVLQQGGGTVKVCKLFPSKYGFPGREAYTITYTPSALGSVTGAVSGVVAPVTDTLQNIAQQVGLPSTVGGMKIGTVLALVAGLFILRKVFV